MIRENESIDSLGNNAKMGKTKYGIRVKYINFLKGFYWRILLIIWLWLCGKRK